MALKIEFQHSQAVVPVRVKSSNFTTTDTLPVSLCTSGQIHVPSDAQPQTIRFCVGVAPEQTDNFLPLVDHGGEFVSLQVEPGRVYNLPVAVLGCRFLRLEAEPGKDFVATLTLKGQYCDRYSTQRYQVKSQFPQGGRARENEPAFSIGSSKRGYLHVPEDHQPPTVKVGFGQRVPDPLPPVKVQPQRLLVFACTDKGGEIRPLIDATGNQVAIDVQPGRAHPLPEAVFDCFFVRFLAEQGKDFPAQIVL